MTKTSPRPLRSAMRWTIALGVAIAQNAVAVYAVHSSAQDVLSDAACLGGVYGTLANLAILGVVVPWMLVLAARSLRARHWHANLGAVLVVALSSTTAILIGLTAALHCTV